ncbi:MAG TPA: hypothetical protein VGM13_15455 [Thermoanaerobaculia bacterium]|jgi:hypothetical protein
MHRTLGPARAASAALTLAFAGIASTVDAQEIRVLSEEVHQFNSPLVLEVSLDALFEKPVGEKWTVDKMKTLMCRGVTIQSLEFRVQPESGSPKKIDFRALLNNNSGKDKRTHLKFECLDRDTVVCVAIYQVNLETGDNDKHRGVLVFRPPEGWNLAPRPSLRITMTLQDY